MKPLVDVVMPTYNHEKFVAQAIESVLAQKTRFECRLNICDDGSSDNTQSIVQEYARKYPEVICPVLASEHLGILHKDRLLTRVLAGCTASYIALLEGDDYWTDPHKLQKQVDFLESHPDFAICCHNATMFYEDGSKEPVNLLPPDYRQVSTLEDLLLENCIPTMSTVFRRGLFGEFPDWFNTLRIGDWPMHILNAQHGKIQYIDEVMAAYRVHQEGFWSSTSPVSQRLEFVKMLDHLDVYLGFKYRSQVRAAKAKWYNELVGICYGNGERVCARHYLKKYFWHSGVHDQRNLLSLLLKLHAPILYRSLRMLKDFASSLKTT